MGNEKSKADSQSGGAAQATVHSKDAASRRSINVQMVQNVFLIWLDSSIDDNSTDWRKSIIQLRRAVNTINTFTDSDECIQFLDNITDNKACMIISGSLGQHIVPRVHSMAQVDSIFIFSDNKKRHEQWIKDWSKIKGVFTELSPICHALRKAAQQCEQNAISTSFIGKSGDLSKQNLDQLDPTFMYTQILKEIFLSIKFKQKHIQEFIDHCRAVFADNEGELRHIDQVEKKYRERTPIWWYTYECFLYPMLNRALRLTDVDIIIKMGFFISDLHRHIARLHSEQFGGHHTGDSFTVYRGQGMSKTDFDQMTKINGGLMSFNNFLSTSKDRNVSLNFARRALPNPDMVGILFVMQIDPRKSTRPFASIVGVSLYEDTENDVLFSMNTVFRIGDIKFMGENHRLFQVDLILTSDNDKDLRLLTDRIQEETFPDETGWQRLGLLLTKMGQFEKAQEVYQRLLERTSDNSENADTYERLGLAKYDQGAYESALEFCEKSLQIRQESLPPDHSHLGYSYNHIGNVYNSMGEYPKALSSYEKALKIWQQSLSSNPLDLAMSYNNIGIVHRTMGDYSKALSSHEKSLEIKRQSLPPNHPDLANSYSNIGFVYENMGNYSEALSSHEKSLEIKQQSLSPNHPDLAMSYNNIGIMHRNMGDYPKALSSHEKALEIRQQSLLPDHPDLSTFYNNIGAVYFRMGKYPKALSCYKKALAIQQRSLPSNHPDLVVSYNDIGTVYCNMVEYSKALSSYTKALEIRQQSLHSNHPDLSSSYNNVGLVYENMGNYSKARSFYERAVDIGQHSLPLNHPDLQKRRENLDRVKKKL